MALFYEGQRVKVAQHATAPFVMWDRAGKITLILPIEQQSINGDSDEQQYGVTFDHTGTERTVRESWLALI